MGTSNSTSHVTGDNPMSALQEATVAFKNKEKACQKMDCLNLAKGLAVSESQSNPRPQTAETLIEAAEKLFIFINQ